jgi:hypothetical protein
VMLRLRSCFAVSFAINHTFVSRFRMTISAPLSF